MIIIGYNLCAAAGLKFHSFCRIVIDSVNAYNVKAKCFLGRLPVHWSYSCCLHWFHPSFCSCTPGPIWHCHEGQDLSRSMIVFAIFSNMLAIYSNAYSLFKKNSPKRE